MSQPAMQPRMVAVAGPLKDQIIPLSGSEMTIGRDLGNTVSLDDAAVSRNHCCIKDEQGEFRIHDFESLNGTFVNDVSVNEQPLHHGDRIQIGSSEFLFLIDEEGAPARPASQGKEELDLSKYNTVVLKHSDSIYLTINSSTDSTAEVPVPSARMTRDLGALFRISHSINVVRGSEDLQHRLLDLIFEVIPAERGGILLIGHNPDVFISRTFKERAAGEGVVRVSRTVTQQVLHDGVAMMSNDVLEDRHFSKTNSLMVSKVRSLLCVPLTVYDKTLGVIYLDTSDFRARFDERHLQLLSAIAAIAAVALEHAQYVEWLEGENQRLQQEISIEHAMVGESPQMHQIHQTIARVAPRESTVLLRGDSGTGKELVARAIHKASKRANKPFIAINCAAISDALLESELFGHEKGAFTDAVALKKGKIEIADGGTLFLDEIGELAPRLQAKLLRVLQEREFNRVGGNDSIKVDIRLIAATNKDLEEGIKTGSFRQDLYFRLNVVSITTPPLSERREDIPVLASHFVKKYSEQCNRHVIGISREALSILRHYDWPGNVRELENAIERAVVLGETDRIIPEDLPEFLLERKMPANVTSTKYHEAVQQLKRHLIIDAVEQAKGTYVEAAKLLGLHPNYLHRLIREMGLKDELKNL